MPHTPSSSSVPDPASGVTVLLIADPGLPTARARSIEEDFQRLLDELYSPPISLEVQTSTLHIQTDGALDLSQAKELAQTVGDPDAVLLLTEIPRVEGARPLIAEIFPEHDIAVISCPTLGVVATRQRILDALMSCTARMKPTQEPRDPSRYERRRAQWRAVPDAEDHQMLLGSRVIGGSRTVLGMVAGNEPFRTAPKLSSALAAALATGAFGIFYNSVWSMSMYLTTQRLLGIGVLAMLTITAWLIVGNRLWEAPTHRRLAGVVLLYNLSTVLTLLMIVGMLYVTLVVVIFISAVIVIDPDYLAVIIEREVTVVRYLDIAWLSAAMGVVAGALGSSFDNDTDRRTLTHGQRERQRTHSPEGEES